MCTTQQKRIDLCASNRTCPVWDCSPMLRCRRIISLFVVVFGIAQGDRRDAMAYGVGMQTMRPIRLNAPNRVWA